jgi:hypothetical protein
MNKQDWAKMNSLPVAVRQKTTDELRQRSKELHEHPEIKARFQAHNLYTKSEARAKVEEDPYYPLLGQEAWYSTLDGRYLYEGMMVRDMYLNLVCRDLHEWAPEVITVYKDGKWQSLKEAYQLDTNTKPKTHV